MISYMNNYNLRRTRKEWIIFEELRVGITPYFIKTRNQQSQIQQNSSIRDMKKTIPRHVELSSLKPEIENVKAMRGKRNIAKRNKRIIANFF